MAGFVGGFVAVSLANETSNETSAPSVKSERNRLFPLCRYKYYNPAKWNDPVSFQFSTLVAGFIPFRNGFVMVS